MQDTVDRLFKGIEVLIEETLPDEPTPTRPSCTGNLFCERTQVRHRIGCPGHIKLVFAKEVS